MLANRLKFLRNYLEAKLWHTLSYGRLKLKFPYNPRKGICMVCDAQKVYTNIHHCCYNFTYDQIRQDNSLALKFTYECCFTCHELSNSVRKLMAEDHFFTVATHSPRIQRIVDFHVKFLKEREIYNRTHPVILGKAAKKKKKGVKNNET